MIYILALVGLVTIVVLLWKSFGRDDVIAPGRVSGPDDDPEFLWKINRDAKKSKRPDAGTGE